MNLQSIADRLYETDVLVVGGGTAGCPAAWKAAKNGLDVIMIEKNHTARSGHCAQGIDTNLNFPRPGVPLKLHVADWQKRHHMFYGEGKFCDPNIGWVTFEKAYWALKQMEDMGCEMRWEKGPDGKVLFIPNMFFGGDENQIAVHWRNIKRDMYNACLKAGVKVLNRIMLIDLLTENGRVIGATCYDTREGSFIVIMAKVVIMAAGPLARTYDSETPMFYKYKYRYHGAPGALSGDGLAAAYRAGAELVNMDIGNCWFYRLRDDILMPIGQVFHRDGVNGRWTDYEGNQYPPIATARLYAELEEAGKTPVFLSQTHLNEDYQKRIEVATADERMVSLKLSEDRGFNPAEHRYEIQPMHLHNFATACGIVVDETFESNTLKGLFAVGDIAAALSSCGPAVTSGMIVGEAMPEYIKNAHLDKQGNVDMNQITAAKAIVDRYASTPDGCNPIELEASVRYISTVYISQYKQANKLKVGQQRLNSLRREFYDNMDGSNPHHLMRCLETRNIMDMQQVHIDACFSRPETRGNYTWQGTWERDPARDDMLTYQRMENGKPVLEIRHVPELKEKYVNSPDDAEIECADLYWDELKKESERK
ncbi:MAG: FAD-dependent oxidoreductase [Parasporobacterium sp.]|nr:FAD-dependent oxidoreductase [Parasporobacterium sp.]